MYRKSEAETSKKPSQWITADEQAQRIPRPKNDKTRSMAGLSCVAK